MPGATGLPGFPSGLPPGLARPPGLLPAAQPPSDQLQARENMLQQEAMSIRAAMERAAAMQAELAANSAQLVQAIQALPTLPPDR